MRRSRIRLLHLAASGCAALSLLAPSSAPARAQEATPRIDLTWLVQEFADPEEFFVGILERTARQPGFARDISARLIEDARMVLANGADERTDRLARFVLCGTSDCTPTPLAAGDGVELLPGSPPVRILSKVKPRTTDLGRRARLEGTVRLRAEIDTAGQVTAVYVIEGLPLDMTEAAVSAVRQWRFARAAPGDPPMRTAAVTLAMGKARLGKLDPSNLSWVNTSTIRLLLIALVLGVAILFYAIRLIFRPFQRRRDRVARTIVRALREHTAGAVPRYRLLLRPFVLYSRQGAGILTSLLRKITGTTRDRYGLKRAGWLEAAFERLAGSREDYLEETIRRITHDAQAPLIALGASRNLGAGKITVGTREWRDLALLLLRNAETIYITPSDHAGTLWEIEQILALDLLDRTVWIMPPALGPRFEHDWNETVELLRALGLNLPRYHSSSHMSMFMLVCRQHALAGATAEGDVAAPEPAV